MERVAGIEPALSGRKHDILPLNYTRKYDIKYTVFSEKVKKFILPKREESYCTRVGTFGIERDKYIQNTHKMPS